MPRALLTDRERDVISGNADVEDRYRYQLVSRIRNRMDRVEGDLAAMEEHGKLAEEFRDMVCDGETDE